ncbi:hypothetical protein [Micromonospora sp. LOL_015]
MQRIRDLCQENVIYLAIGFDVIKVGSDGRIATISGFLDRLPG